VTAADYARVVAQRDALVAEIDQLAVTLPHMSAETWPFAVQALIERRKQIVPENEMRGAAPATPAPPTSNGR
jgi:hypothetical protein